MSFTAIFNCDLFTPAERIPQGLVLVEGHQIRAIGRSKDIVLPLTTRLLDAQGGRITPGLIDLAGVTSVHNHVTAWGITSHLVRVSVRDERDLPKISAAAARLRHPSSGARALGLHLTGLWPQLNDKTSHWQDLWIAADATIKLITPSKAMQATGMTLLRDSGARLAILTEWAGKHRAGGGLEDANVALWGVSEEGANETTNYYLATPDHIHSADRSVLRALLSSHRLILTGDSTRTLNTRSVRQLMAQADANFASALIAATLAPAKFLALPLGRLAAGAPADLICWTRHGDLAWTMVNGEIAPPASPPPAGKRRPQRPTRSTEA